MFTRQYYAINTYCLCLPDSIMPSTHIEQHRFNAIFSVFLILPPPHVRLFSSRRCLFTVRNSVSHRNVKHQSLQQRNRSSNTDKFDCSVSSHVTRFCIFYGKHISVGPFLPLGDFVSSLNWQETKLRIEPYSSNGLGIWRWRRRRQRRRRRRRVFIENHLNPWLRIISNTFICF